MGLESFASTARSGKRRKVTGEQGSQPSKSYKVVRKIDESLI